MDPIILTKKLISIPSYVHDKTNEKELADFIYKYLKKIPFLIKLEKQKMGRGRFNIIAGDGFKPKLLLISHMDTVEPRGWKRNPFEGTIKGNKLYGLGSMDMKGGLAAILSSLKDFRKTRGLMLLFYCDEEYDFKGMKKFINEYKIFPQLALSAEPTDLKIWNGARGIIKISFQAKGKTAPASRQDLGKNAIWGATGAIKFLEKKLKKYKTKNLGPSTCNLAAIFGGLDLGKDKNGKQIISQQGDAVPDIAQVMLDIRSGHPFLSSEIIKKTLIDFLLQKKFKLIKFIVHHNLEAFYTEQKELKLVEKIIKETIGKADYLNLRQMGYQDIQMINKKFRIPALSFGPRGGQRHQPDEWVWIKDLDRIKKIYQDLIRQYCS